MKRYVYLLGMAMTTIMLLTGCGQLEGLLQEAMSFLDGDNNDEANDNNINNQDEKENHTNNHTNNANGNEENDSNINDQAENNTDNDGNVTQANTAQHETPFDERLLEQGYSIYTLPNGFPFEVPYHWVFVEQPSEAEYQFCYDLPLSIEQMEVNFEYFDIVSVEANPSADVLQETTFEMDFGYEVIEGKFIYFLDEYDNTCVTVQLGEGSGDGGEWDGLGEDPATMEDDDSFEADIGNGDHDEGRTRQLTDGFAEWFDEYADEPVEFSEPPDVESIRGKIANGELEMMHLANGHPVVFPYEWYLLAREEDHYNGAWTGTFCTDSPMKTTVTKHVNMLADLNADIIDYHYNPSPSMNQLANFDFAFNDIYGTGSWKGTSIIYVDRLQNFQTHKCISVDMEFSPDILN